MHSTLSEDIYYKNQKVNGLIPKRSIQKLDASCGNFFSKYTLGTSRHSDTGIFLPQYSGVCQYSAVAPVNAVSGHIGGRLTARYDLILSSSSLKDWDSAWLLLRCDWVECNNWVSITTFVLLEMWVKKFSLLKVNTHSRTIRSTQPDASNCMTGRRRHQKSVEYIDYVLRL